MHAATLSSLICFTQPGGISWLPSPCIREPHQGDVAPVRVLRELLTRLWNPYRIAVDGEHNMLVIANRDPLGFLVFNRDDSGDVAPKAMISGPNTGL